MIFIVIIVAVNLILIMNKTFFRLMGSITIAVTVVVVKIMILILIVLKEKTVSLARQNALNKRRNSLCVVI